VTTGHAAIRRARDLLEPSFILMQSGVAMLAQANQLPQNLLRLLQ
jgi:hypothetical protein